MVFIVLCTEVYDNAPEVMDLTMGLVLQFIYINYIIDMSYGFNVLIFTLNLIGNLFFNLILWCHRINGIFFVVIF